MATGNRAKGIDHENVAGLERFDRLVRHVNRTKIVAQVASGWNVAERHRPTDNQVSTHDRMNAGHEGVANGCAELTQDRGDRRRAHAAELVENLARNVDGS
jgi:hypothetical protein